MSGDCAGDCPTCGGVSNDDEGNGYQVASDWDPALPAKGGWKTPPSPVYHPCDVPVMTYRDAERVWECPECEASWTLTRRAPLTLVQHVMPVIPWVPEKHKASYPIPSYVSEEERYAPTDLTAPAGESLPLPNSNVTLLDEHAKDCAHRTGKGMCSCKVRLST